MCRSMQFSHMQFMKSTQPRCLLYCRRKALSFCSCVAAPIPSHHPSLLAPTDLFLILIIFILLEYYIKETMQSMCPFVIGFLKIVNIPCYGMHCSLFKPSLVKYTWIISSFWLLQMSYHEHPCTESFCHENRFSLLYRINAHRKNCCVI